MLIKCQNTRCEMTRLCDELHKLGYEDKPNWLAVLLFARNIVGALSIVNSTQKNQAQALVFDRLAKKDHSNENFMQIIKGVEDLLVHNQKTASWLSELASYKHHSDSMTKAVSEFVAESLSAESGRDTLVTNFGAKALEALNTKDGVDLDIPKLRVLVTNMLAHYRDEAQKWEQKAKQLEQIVNVDPMLNTIHNRRALDLHLQASIEKAKIENLPLSLLMIDVDDFKNTINDTYGHQVGDDVLRTLAKILTAHASKNNFFAARYGGDELVLVCNLTGNEAEHHADAIRYAVQSYEFRSRVGDKISDDVIRFTVSIGVAEYSGNWSAAELLNAADKAMYNVKSAGKNSVSRFCVVNTQEAIKD